MLSFNMERRPEVAASLLMNQVCFTFLLNFRIHNYYNFLLNMLLKEFANRERLRVPLPPPLPPPRPEINNRMYNSIMHDMLRSSDRLGIPVHDRLAVGRVPIKEDRRRIRRRSIVMCIYI